MSRSDALTLLAIKRSFLTPPPSRWNVFALEMNFLQSAFKQETIVFIGIHLENDALLHRPNHVHLDAVRKVRFEKR